MNSGANVVAYNQAFTARTPHITSTAGPNSYDCRSTIFTMNGSRGWVPKAGLKFGVDFLVYRRGPAFFHSRCNQPIARINHDCNLVIIQLLDSCVANSEDSNRDTLDTAVVLARNHNPWVCCITADLYGTQADFCPRRLSNQVSKEVVLFHVNLPENFNIHELSTPACLRRFSCQEVLLRRWIPERNRDRRETSVVLEVEDAD